MENNANNAFEKLLEVADILNSKDGCPWDLKQTFTSLSRYVLEEAHEVVDAVHHGNDAHILDELGDLFYTVVFYGKVAQREGRFDLSDIIEHLREKLIRRHPHVFGEITIEHEDEIAVHWERIKKEEKKGQHAGPFDDIPKNMPALTRATKVIKRIRKQQPDLLKNAQTDDLGEAFIELISRCEQAGYDPETLLRQTLAKYERAFVGNSSLSEGTRGT